MSAVRKAVLPAIKTFPGILTTSDVAKIRAMVIERRPTPEIAATMKTTTQKMEFYLRNRRRYWLDDFNEGRIDFLAHKTVIYRRRSSDGGGFTVLPFSLPRISMHVAALEAQA